MVHFDQNRDVSQKPPQSGQKWANAGSGGIPMLKVVSNFRSGRRGGRCSFFLTVQCFGNVFDKTIDLNVFGDVWKKTLCSRCKLALFFT